MSDAPVFIVDDDIDERLIVQEIWEELQVKNPPLFFDSGQAVLDHLKKDPTNPFMIICDVNLPKMDGFQLRERFAEETSIHYLSIPFIFWSTVASNEQIKKAYDLGAQGFFLKGFNYKAMKESLNAIITYWQHSKAPIIV